MRAILVCVDYADFLAITLPRNLHHFESVMVVTAPKDTATIELCQELNVQTHITESFYDHGANFNKFKAMEEALNVYGRTGWLCIMDADIIWPTILPEFRLEVGKLYTPRRRMLRTNYFQELPPEERWHTLPLHRNEAEWAGYSQIFHCSDPILGKPPWHGTNWKHAGGADSFFQAKWSRPNKIRPTWEVLHLGEDGRNWCGRVTPLADGTHPPEAVNRLSALRGYFAGRRRSRSFNQEQIPPH